LLKVAASRLPSCSSSATAALAQGKTKLLCSASELADRIAGRKVIVIDPLLTAGPKGAGGVTRILAKLGKVDLLLVTHAHVDHIGDAPAIAKIYKTKLHGPADMVTPLISSACCR